MEAGLNSDPGNDSFSDKIRDAKHVDRSTHYSTFTYYGSLEIEKLIKIVIWAQIGCSQALEAGKCDFDSFCFAYSHGKLFARS